MQAATPEQILFQAYRLEQLGRLSEALALYRQAAAALPNNLMAQVRSWRLARDLRTPSAGAVTLIWQFDPQKSWEREWVRHLLSALSVTEIVDCNHREFRDAAIVVDNHLNPAKRAYYFEMLKRGHRFGLFHLSDEHYADDCTAYEFASFVIRNYWSPAHAANKRVLAVPLGMMNGLHVDASRPCSARKRLWSFAGEINKSTRKEMIDALTALDPGFVHPTGASSPAAAAQAKAPLPIDHYAALIADTVFVPCPQGWENLDSFRVYEALEAGCIPIVERRPQFDYFRLLLGEHPMVTIDDWKEAPEAIRALQRDPAALEARRAACTTWWQATKRALVDRVRDHCVEGFGHNGATLAP